MRKVLIITYYFPPAGGSGVHRAWAMARHLPEYGYEPLILTAGQEWRPPVVGISEPADPVDCRVVRTPPDGVLRSSRMLGRLFGARLADFAKVLDPRGLWWLSAARAGRDILRRERIHAVLTTSPPYGVSLAGAALSRQTGVPWVADFRDPWALTLVQPWLGGVGYFLDRGMQSLCMQRADAVILNTPACYQALRRLHPRLAEDKAVWITNGFRGKVGVSGVSCPGGLLRIAHVGIFYWNERAWARERSLSNRLGRRLRYTPDELDQSAHSAGFLLRALRKALDARPEMSEKVRVTLVGQLHPADVKLIAELGLSDIVEATGHLPWEEANAHAEAADVLYLPFWHSTRGRPILRVPSKTYEYLASGKPILALVDDGDVKDFLTRAGTGIFCPEFSIDALSRALCETYERHAAGTLRVQQDRAYVGQFSWPNIVRRIAGVLDRAIERRRPSWDFTP